MKACKKNNFNSIQFNDVLVHEMDPRYRLINIKYIIITGQIYINFEQKLKNAFPHLYIEIHIAQIKE